MNIFKRVWVSVGASVDSFAGKLENQEAVAEGIIDDMEEAVIRVRGELIKTRNEIKRLQTNLNTQNKEKESWTVRARDTAESDRNKALQCVKFVKNAETNIKDITVELVEMKNVERELLQSVTEGEKQLAELRRKKRVLASRQTRAEATSYARNASGSVFGEAEDLFSRWEAKVGRTEGITDNCSTEADLLAMEYASEEEASELDSLLNEIIDN